MPPVVWFYGLSGSGKTTLATHAHVILQAKYYPVVFLDADVLRQTYWPELGLSKNARLDNATRISQLAKSYNDVQCAVIVAACVPFHEQREAALNILPHIKFIHVDTPLVICESRKPHTYGVANPHKVTSIDIEPEPWAVIDCNQSIDKSLPELSIILDRL
jgi:adenylylsulfate kinase